MPKKILPSLFTVVLLLVPTIADAHKPKPPRAKCHQKVKGMKTLAETPKGKIYTIADKGHKGSSQNLQLDIVNNGTFYGCWKSTQRRTTLVSGLGSEQDDEGYSGWVKFALYPTLQGEFTSFVDYAYSYVKADWSESYRLWLVNLRTGVTSTFIDRFPNDFGQDCGFTGVVCQPGRNIQNLALNANGVVVWAKGKRDEQTKTNWTDLIIRDTAGIRKIDSGNIDPKSIALTNSTVTWTKDGAQQTLQIEDKRIS